MDWTIDGLTRAGFVGWVPFSAMAATTVPAGPGVYMVVRADAQPPEFLEASTSGWHKKRDPTVARARLEKAWVSGVPVLYIGTATSLAGRLGAYDRHGTGANAGHSGGRFIWQLAGSRELVVIWKETPLQDPECVEGALIRDFTDNHSVRPFANRKRGKSCGGDVLGIFLATQLRE